MLIIGTKDKPIMYSNTYAYQDLVRSTDFSYKPFDTCILRELRLYFLCSIYKFINYRILFEHVMNGITVNAIMSN